jgi:CRISPR/Cas system-associated exonuclease Cas4 (RecB family)
VSRPIVPLHTIDQWFSVPKEVQDLVLRAIKIRDRLWAFRLVMEQQKIQPFDPHWAPCRRCSQTGWVSVSPRKAGIHPSAMTSSCLLKIYNEAIGVQKQITNEARELLIFDLGTAAHDMLQSFGLKGAWGPHYQPEVSVGDTQIAKELMIEGHADADSILIVDEIAGAPIFEVGIIHEYKTINDNGFESLKNKPKPQHKQQATVYSACLNRPVTVYLYMNKNNSNLADFPVVFEPHLWEIMRGKAVTVRDAVLSGSPPPADVGYHCNQCGYVYDCAAYKQAKNKKG